MFSALMMLCFVSKVSQIEIVYDQVRTEKVIKSIIEPFFLNSWYSCVVNNSSGGFLWKGLGSSQPPTGPLC